MGNIKRQPAVASTPDVMVPHILNECQRSQATHPRGIKKLVDCRATNREEFLRTWVRCLQPLFLVSKREPVVERMLKFAASFTAYWDETCEDDCEHFVEEFLGVLLKWVDASHKSVRFRACQMISEVILKLPDDVPVVDELWDNIISSMQRRMQDKLTSVRVYAALALSRLVITDDIENDRTVRAYRQALETDQSAEVRKMVVLSMPAMNVTVADIVERTADISEVVRKATYHILGSKFRIQSLSIMQRALILQRGLAERVPGVRAECVEMLKSMWLERDCEENIISLLRYLDVETHEKVGENVMLELLKQDFNMKARCSGGLRQFLPSDNETGEQGGSCKLLDAEQALYWRMLCTHLHSEAEARGSDAATSGGAEAVVKAAAAADSNDYLDDILPPTVADYVHLVEAHLRGGPSSRFAARQLLLISKLMNFADNTSRRAAAALLQSLLGVDSAQSERSLEDMFGDGLNLGGDELWANAVGEMAHHVHSSPGEFTQVLAASLADQARPCREGGADVVQWLHCLAITGLLLESIGSLHQLDGQAIEPQEIHDSLLIPAVKHLHPEVQRAGVRCLGIFYCLERAPSSRGVEELRLCLSFSNRSYVQEMAFKALFDLVLCHGATTLDDALGIGHDGTGSSRPPGVQIRNLFISTGDSSEREHSIILRCPLLELLAESFNSDDSVRKEEALCPRTAIAAEGFAKLLLQSKRFSEVRGIQDALLENLIRLYFSVCTHNHPRLRQCLNVFFRSYCSQSAENKRAISKVFVPVMRKEWPGIYGNQEKSGTVLAARKHATEIGRFMLLLLRLPLSAEKTQSLRKQVSGTTNAEATSTENPDEEINEGHEELAIRIFAEVISFHPKKSMAGKTYMATLARYCSLLHYRASQHEEIKCLYQILPTLIENLPQGEKTLLKELKDVRVLLRALNTSPEKNLTDKEIHQIMERLEVEHYGEEVKSPEVDATPVKASKTTGRRRNSNTFQNSSVIRTPVPSSTRTLRKRPESVLPLAKSQTKTKAPRKNLDSLYESGNSDFDFPSDTTAASSSESDYEVRSGGRLKGKASSKGVAGVITSNQLPRGSTDSQAAKSAVHHGDESTRGDLDEDNNSVEVGMMEGDDGEDEASPLPAGRKKIPRNARRTSTNRVLKHSSFLNNSFESEDGSSDFEPLPSRRRMSQVL